MQKLEECTAVILAGGMGTRLRPVISDKPKVLAEIGGRPFLAFLLDQLAGVGIRHVVLCTGYLGDYIEDVLGHDYEGIRLSYSKEMEPLGTGGALRRALACIESDPALVMNGDSFCQADLHQFWAAHVMRCADASLLLIEVPDTRRYGLIELTRDDRVVGFHEKKNESGQGWISAGLYLLSRRVIRSIPAGIAVSLEHEVFPGLIGHGLYGYRNRGRFIDIGTPESYAAAETFFQQ